MWLETYLLMLQLCLATFYNNAVKSWKSNRLLSIVLLLITSLNQISVIPSISENMMHFKAYFYIFCLHYKQKKKIFLQNSNLFHQIAFYSSIGSNLMVTILYITRFQNILLYIWEKAEILLVYRIVYRNSGCGIESSLSEEKGQVCINV